DDRKLAVIFMEYVEHRICSVMGNSKRLDIERAERHIRFHIEMETLLRRNLSDKSIHRKPCLFIRINGHFVSSSEHADPFNVIAMLMSDKNAVYVRHGAADFFKLLLHPFRTKSSIDQKSMLFGLYIYGIARTAACEHTESHMKNSLFFFILSRIKFFLIHLVQFDVYHFTFNGIDEVIFVG